MISELISDEITKLEGCKATHLRIQIISNIIEFIDSDSTTEFAGDRYKYVRLLIKESIECSEQYMPGYMLFDAKRILEIINRSFSDDEKLSLLRYCYRVCLQNHYLEEAKLVTKALKKTRVKASLKNFQVKGIFSLFYNLVDYSLITLIFAVLVLFLFHCIFLLPAFDPKFALFNIEYETYSSNFHVNHLLNIVASGFIEDSEFKIVPTGATGLIIYTCEKIFVYLFAFAYLAKKIKSIIGLDE